MEVIKVDLLKKAEYEWEINDKQIIMHRQKMDQNKMEKRAQLAEEKRLRRLREDEEERQLYEAEDLDDLAMRREQDYQREQKRDKEKEKYRVKFIKKIEQETEQSQKKLNDILYLKEQLAEQVTHKIKESRKSLIEKKRQEHVKKQVWNEVMKPLQLDPSMGQIGMALPMPMLGNKERHDSDTNSLTVGQIESSSNVP